MKIYIKGYEDSKQGRNTLYNGCDKKSEFTDIPINKIGEKMNEIYGEDFGDMEIVEIKIRHKTSPEIIEQDDRYIKAVGIDLEERILISFAQMFVLGLFLTFYIAWSNTIPNFHRIVFGDGSLGELFLLFFVNSLFTGMFLGIGGSIFIFLVRQIIFTYKERKRVKCG